MASANPHPNRPRIRPLGRVDRPLVGGEILVPLCSEKRKLDRPIPPVIERIQRALLRIAYRSAIDAGDFEVARSLYPRLAVEVWLDSITTPAEGNPDSWRQSPPPVPPSGR